LISCRQSLSSLRGIAFAGGFSFADVLGSAKGWAAKLRFHSQLFEQFEEFYLRSDTFSIGICNGCQLMTTLGLVPLPHLEDER
jgi:phosphoribosylformylglycinamidine synthase